MYNWSYCWHRTIDPFLPTLNLNRLPQKSTTDMKDKICLFYEVNCQTSSDHFTWFECIITPDWWLLNDLYWSKWTLYSGPPSVGGLILILISTLIINRKTFILLIAQHFMTAGHRSFDHFNLNDQNVCAVLGVLCDNRREERELINISCCLGDSQADIPPGSLPYPASSQDNSRIHHRVHHTQAPN